MKLYTNKCVLAGGHSPLGDTTRYCTTFRMLLPLLVLLASLASATAVGTCGPLTTGSGQAGNGIYICSTDDSDPCPTSLAPNQTLCEVIFKCPWAIPKFPPPGSGQTFSLDRSESQQARLLNHDMLHRATQYTTTSTTALECRLWRWKPIATW